MQRIDFFCAPDDEHRVILLTDLLARAGQEVALRKAAVRRPTQPCVVACTRRALGELWIRRLFEDGHDVLAIRLDDAPLPGPCARVVDMQAWPARSADRQVGVVVRWLANRAGGAEGADGAAPVRPAAPRPHRHERLRNAAGTAAVVILAAGTVALLWISAPERRADEDATVPQERP
ncbi:MAG: hypothetical protein ACODAC_09520, partial [Pseudomonadota bacterium]